MLLDTLHEQLSMTGSNLRCLPSNNIPVTGAGSSTALHPVINSLNNMDTSPPKISLDWTINSQSSSDNSKLSQLPSDGTNSGQSTHSSHGSLEIDQSPVASCTISNCSHLDQVSPSVAQSENNSIPQEQDSELENNNGVPCDRLENNVVLQDQDKVILDGKTTDEIHSSGESLSTDATLSQSTDTQNDFSTALSDAEHSLNLKRLKLQAESNASSSSCDSVTQQSTVIKLVEESNGLPAHNEDSSSGSETQHTSVLNPVEQSNNTRLTPAAASTALPSDLSDKNVIHSSSDSKSDNVHVQLNNNIRVSKLPPDLLDFYCKESKTLNTNVLINEYSEEFVSTDSEKFAKQDNRFHTQSEENSILQEAVGIVDEDKNDKDSSGNNFGIKDVNLHANKKKSRLISKSCTNVLKMDYTVGVGEYGMNNFKRIKMESVDLEEKCSMDEDLSKGDVEEKNIQMQALSKFNTCRNISDDASDNESCDSMEVEGDGFVADLESSEDEETIASMNSIPTGGPSASPRHQTCSPLDIDAANKAWEDYIVDNNSIVVQSFQGQFKSTVKIYIFLINYRSGT